MADALTVHDLSFRYAGTSHNALDHVSFSVPGRSCTAILGNSDSGKSTLLHALAGSLALNAPNAESSGNVAILDRPYHPLPSVVLFPSVGLVHQEASLMVSGMFETVEEEISASVPEQNDPTANPPYAIAEILALLQIEPLARRNPTELSGGELRKVATASILIANPQILFLDHPGVGLDQHSLFSMASLFRMVKRSSTIVFSDTSADLALLTADAIVVLEAGRVIFSGTRREFLDAPGILRDRLRAELWDDLAGKLRASGNRRIQQFVGMT